MITLIIATVTSALISANLPEGHVDVCVGTAEYKNITFNVMKKSVFGFMSGYATSKKPTKNDLAWSVGGLRIKKWNNYQYTKNEFISFLPSLKPTGKTRNEIWDAMYVSYEADNKKCVMSVSMNLKKIRENYGVEANTKYIVYVNGKEFSTTINPYTFFYDGIGAAGFMDTSYH